MKFKIILIVIILAILGGAFYWFEWRPAQIRKMCYTEKQYYREDLKGITDEKANELTEQRYQDCLRKFGVEK